MKKIISLILVFSMIFSLISFSAVFSDENIVFTEDFEKGIDSWKGGSASQGKFTVETSIVKEGKASLKVNDDTDVAIGIASQRFSVDANTEYTLTADFNNESGNAVNVYIRTFDKSGERLSSNSKRSSESGWKSITLTITTPENANTAEVYIAASSSNYGVAYIDNILVKKGAYVKPKEEAAQTPPPVLSEDMLFYENFERGTNGWQHTNDISKEKIDITDTIYSEGSHSVRVKDDVTEKQISYKSPDFSVIGETQITVAVDMYIFYGTAVKVYVQMFDENNSRVYSSSFTTKGRKWALGTLICDVPATAVKANINISGISTSQGDACVDNVRVYKGKKDVKSDFSKAQADNEGERVFTFKDIYEMPDFIPEKGMHPRVYFNKNDIERIKKNSTHPQNKSAYEQFLKEVNSAQDGTIASKTGNNLNSTLMSIIQSKAFYYAVWGDEAKGREAVSSMHNFIKDANVYDSAYNEQGFMVFTIGAVYDWCYPLLTEEDKKIFQNAGLIAASTMEIGFPPTASSVVNSHAAEAMLQRDQMAFAIAVSDERQDIYKNVAGRYFKEMVEAKKFLASSHSSLFGNSYANYRYQWEVLSVFMMRALGFDDIYGDEHKNVLYWNMYAKRPDGSSLHDGDSVSNNQPIESYDERGTRAFFLAGNCYKDPYLKGEALRHNNGIIIGDTGSNQDLSSIEVLCFNNPEVGYSSVKELPLSKYFPSPRGEMIARTSWAEGIKAPSVVAQLNIGEYWTQGHDHADSGEFEIYYKGALANDTGYYQAGRDGSTGENSGNTVSGTFHDKNYQKRTIAHNCMIVFDPDEDVKTSYKGYANDGGQLLVEDNLSNYSDLVNKKPQASVLGQEIGTDTITPDYTYIKGDIAKAYGEKVSEYERSFMFLNLKNNDYPAVIIVFDRVKAKDKTFDKKWILHGLNEPQINGTRTVFKDTRTGYNGKLTVDTLLPKNENVNIEAVGGKDKEYLVNGVNYWAQTLAGKRNEGGGYRIEISPKADSYEDYFLNVMQVADADSPNEPLKSEMIESKTHTGVKIYDRIVMFGKLKDRVSTDVSFAIADDGWFKFSVADLKEGTWQVKKDGNILCEIVSAKDGGVGSFEGGRGNYTLTYLGAYGEKVFTSTSHPSTEGINLKLEPANKYIYSDVDPFTVNGRTLVPLRAIFEALEAKVTWDEKTATATGEKNGTVIKITENSEIAFVNGSEYKLDAPAMVKDGRFVVPVRFIAESFGINVDWDDFSKTVIIRTEKGSNAGVFKAEYKPRHEVENALTVYSLTQYGSVVDTIENVVDGSFNTGWAVREDEKGNQGYGIFDFGSVKTIDSIRIAYKMGDSRKYTFSVYVSDDNKNYTLVKDKLISSGATTDFEAFDLGGVKGRYVKFVGYGNITNTWNNIGEILFTGK